MSFYSFQLNYKLNKKQLKMINTNLQIYCDKINCKKFESRLCRIREDEENIYLLDIDIYDDIENEDIEVVNLIEFYLNNFELGNDDKIF